MCEYCEPSTPASTTKSSATWVNDECNASIEYDDYGVMLEVTLVTGSDGAPYECTYIAIRNCPWCGRELMSEGGVMIDKDKARDWKFFIAGVVSSLLILTVVSSCVVLIPMFFGGA